MITANNHKKSALHCHSQDNLRRNYSIKKAVSLRLRRGTAESNMEKKGKKFHTSLSLRTLSEFEKEQTMKSKLCSAHS